MKRCTEVDVKKLICALLVTVIVGYPKISFSAYQLCVDSDTVTGLEVGYIPDDPSGGDSGNAVKIFTKKSGIFYLYYKSNMNDTSGRGMFAILQMAFTLNLPISARGRDTQCSDGFYQVMIHGV